MISTQQSTSRQIATDRTGFPMVWVSSINAYLGFLPASKIQFEYFLSSTSAMAFTAEKYDEILATNGRVTPNLINRQNFWQAFITGLTPVESERFVGWVGGDDSSLEVPNSNDWSTAYQELQETAPISLEQFESLNLMPRISLLFAKLDSVTRSLFPKRTLAQQMLMQGGVLEWVQDADQWAGLGVPSDHFEVGIINPQNPRPVVPNDPTRRVASNGIRLMRTGR